MAHHGEWDPAVKNGSQRADYELDDAEDHTFADPADVDLAEPATMRLGKLLTERSIKSRVID
jgi:hypothetical protein